MTSALPSNLHAELALDRGRLSREGERSGARSITRTHATTADPHARVQSLHGVILETNHYVPSPMHGAIAEEPRSGVLSGGALAAMLDEEDDDDEIIRSPHAVQWNEQRGPDFAGMQDQQSQYQVQQQQRTFAPRQASLNSPASQPQSQGGANPKSILQNRSETLSPPPRSSSSWNPVSAPAHQQAFPDKPRFALTDDGPMSAPPSPDGADQFGGQPPFPRAVSDSYPHPSSAPNSPGLGVTPPLRRGAETQPSTPTRYASFEEMGIQGKGAEKEKDCVIM